MLLSMKKVTRIGVYGICRENNCMLLVPKKSGPYKGMLDLPGGGIEFGEAPEETLRREFEEEVASSFNKAELLFNVSYFTEHSDLQFHHVGMIYSISGRLDLTDKLPEDEFYWIELPKLAATALTPFAAHAVKYLEL